MQSTCLRMLHKPWESSFLNGKIYVAYKKLHNFFTIINIWQAFTCQIFVYVKCRMLNSYFRSVEIYLNIQNTFFGVNQVS